MANQGKPAAGFKFNDFQEIKSHSSILFNERLAIQFYLLDQEFVHLHATRDINFIYRVRARIKQIYKNVRMLLRYNPTVRATLNLDTKDEGIYITDVRLAWLDKLIDFSEEDKLGFTKKRIVIIIQELDGLELILKDCLQYFHYFIRPDFRQKPDIEIATERYKEMADKRTVEELRALVGKNHRVDFNSLGTKKIELEPQIEYDPLVDGELKYLESDDSGLGGMEDDE